MSGQLIYSSQYLLNRAQVGVHELEVCEVRLNEVRRWFFVGLFYLSAGYLAFGVSTVFLVLGEI